MIKNIIAFGFSKPYDAEIEYLESTGTQWIDTDIIDDPGSNRIEIEFMCTTDTGTNQTLYASSSQKFNYILLRKTSKGIFFGLTADTTPKLPITIGNRHSGSFCITDKLVYTLDGTEGVFNNTIHYDNLPLSIFRNPQNENTFFVGRIYRFHIVSQASGEVLHDLVPVRTGSEGFIYDKITGKAYYNTGTGEFVLGPDVNRDAFILVSPTQTAIHYPPIVTTDTFSPDEDFRIELRYKCLLNGLGSWGTILGTTGGTNNNGINLRQRDATNEAYFLVGGVNSQFFDCSNWVDLSFSPSEGLVVNGTIVLSPTLIDMSKFTSTNPLYIGEGPRGYGATCASAWKYVRIYRNGVMTRNYIPHVSGSFIDTVSGNILAVDSRSTTTVKYYKR